MKAILWLVAAGSGFALMAWSYFAYQRVNETVPWAYGLMYVAALDAAGTGEPIEFEHAATRIRLLPPSELATALLQAVGAAGGVTKEHLGLQLREKLILLSPADAAISRDLLAWGRLPTAGRGEVLAGYQSSCKDRLTVAGRSFKVVGVLRRDMALLAASYLIPPHDSLSDLFDVSDESVRAAVLIRLTSHQFRDKQVLNRLTAAYPGECYTMLFPVVRTARGPFYLYMAGLTMLLLGGSGWLIAVYTAFKQRACWRMLCDPLTELAHRRRLLWVVHLGYFGLVVVVALIVYELPELQTALLGTIRGEIAGGKGPLGLAGKAYGSGHIPLAALVTFALNFFLGSIAMITLPSFVVPGIGALLAAFRALAWGLLLAPTFSVHSSAMLSHSWTLLLEGEAYVLAAFFAMLIPMYLGMHSMGGDLLRRYGQALVMNVKGNLLIAIVLLVSACYEAVEVIMMSR